MKLRYLSPLALLTLALTLPGPARAQSSGAKLGRMSYGAVVKLVGLTVASPQPQYGLVTGTGPNEAYFVLATPDREFLDQHPRLTVLGEPSRKNAAPASAEQVQPPEAIGTGGYYLALYRMPQAALPPANRLPFRGSSPSEPTGYHLILDLVSEQDKDKSMELDANPGQVELAAAGAGGRPDRFTLSGKRTRQVQVGMPVLDKNNFLVGLALLHEPPPDERPVPSFEVLDLLLLRKTLEKYGQRAAGDPCRYFNLLEALHAYTPCEEARRTEQQRQAEQQAQAERQARLTQAERRAEHHDHDYPFALSATGALYAGGLPFATSGTSSSGDFKLSYSYGLTLDLAPDAGPLRLSLRPRYASYAFAPSGTYSYGSTSSGFALRQGRVTTLEVPALLEFVLDRGISGSGYFGLGYAYGRQRTAEFTYVLTGQDERTEPLLGNPVGTHKLLLEVGGETGKVRMALNAGVQFSRLVRSDYQFIVGGETITPFRDATRGYLQFGAELSYRLWGRWQNGVIHP